MVHGDSLGEPLAMSVRTLVAILLAPSLFSAMVALEGLPFVLLTLAGSFREIMLIGVVMTTTISSILELKFSS